MPRCNLLVVGTAAIILASASQAFGQSEYVRLRSVPGSRACTADLAFDPMDAFPPYTWSDSDPVFAEAIGVVLGEYNGRAHAELDFFWNGFTDPDFAACTAYAYLTAQATEPPGRSAIFGGEAEATHEWFFNPVGPPPPGTAPIGTCTFQGGLSSSGSIALEGDSSCEGFGSITITSSGGSPMVFGSYMTLSGPIDVPPHVASGFNYVSNRFLDDGGPGSGSGNPSAQTATASNPMGSVSGSTAQGTVWAQTTLYGNYQ